MNWWLIAGKMGRNNLVRADGNDGLSFFHF